MLLKEDILMIMYIVHGDSKWMRVPTQYNAHCVHIDKHKEYQQLIYLLYYKDLYIVQLLQCAKNFYTHTETATHSLEAIQTIHNLLHTQCASLDSLLQTMCVVGVSRIQYVYRFQTMCVEVSGIYYVYRFQTICVGVSGMHYLNRFQAMCVGVSGPSMCIAPRLYLQESVEYSFWNTVCVTLLDYVLAFSGLCVSISRIHVKLFLDCVYRFLDYMCSGFWTMCITSRLWVQRYLYCAYSFLDYF